MLKVKIYTIGKCKESWLQEALNEYEKRLISKIQIEWVLAKNDADLETKITSPYICLDVQGDLIDSVRLSQKLTKFFELYGSKLHFLIGGANGIPKHLLDKSIWRWSLSPLTFTHQITRLLFLEQLYRANEIIEGSSYHK